MVETDIAVRTVGLTKTFRDFWMREKVTAVRDLDLAIQTREVYGLLGPNGSGKSTTIKMILGLMFPSKGQVSVFGRGPRDVAGKARIGFLPEESYLYPFLDAYETLDYYGQLFHQPRAERKRRIDMLLDMVGLTGVAYRRVGEYSKGMQRRIGMAQALINDPELLILDEPTSGMDPLAARQFKELILELSRRGKTIILSSHLLADMEDVCHRVGILFAGQLRSQGTLGELLARPSLTQITTEHLDAATVAEIKAVLSRRDKKLLGMEVPRDRLESLFLRIVREAQAQRVSAGVAVETGQLAEFLRASPGEKQGEAVIEELLAPQAPAVTATAPTPSLPLQPRADVLNELLSPKETPAPPPATPANTLPPEKQDHADRSVIESLIQPQEKRTDA